MGYYNGGEMYRHFVYMFQHGSPLHLLMNSVVFISMFRFLKGMCNKWILLIVIYSVSVITSFIVGYDTPCVGASGMNYVMIGMYCSILTPRFVSWVKMGNKKDIKSYTLFLVSLVLALIMSCLFRQSAFLLHILCLFSGILFILTNKFIKNERLFQGERRTAA